MNRMCRHIAALLLAVAWQQTAAQDPVPLDLAASKDSVPQSLVRLELPRPGAPALAVPVAGHVALPTPEAGQWRHGRLGKAVQPFAPEWKQMQPAVQRLFRFGMNPYSGDYAQGGVIARVGNGYLSGTSTFAARPALGNVGSASIALTQQLADNFSITAGLAGNKYHFGREAWNSYGLWGAARWQLNERFSLNVFGQYYRDQHFHSVAALPFIESSRYGGTLGIKMSDAFALAVGAQRYYDVYTGRWRTVPIVAPTLTLMGAPISVDVGGLLYQVLDAILGSGRNDGSYSPAGHSPGTSSPAPMPAGFNPNSPVRIPDALR